MHTRKFLATVAVASILTAGTAMGMAATNPENRSAEQTTSDTALASKVKTALIENDTTKARQINVEVFKGMVQLNGFVDTAEQQREAAKVAGAIAGAGNVKNNLEIKQNDRTAGTTLNDGMITAKVKAALVGDSRTKAHQINVTTREGIVELGGFVDSPAAKSAASEVAQSIDGVKSVKNGLDVKK